MWIIRIFQPHFNHMEPLSFMQPMVDSCSSHLYYILYINTLNTEGQRDVHTYIESYLHIDKYMVICINILKYIKMYK
jgi:hypothetical protein